jgi:hypothetical protein
MFDQAAHDRIKRKNKAFALTAIILAIIFVALRMILIKEFIDPEDHFYIDAANTLVLSVDYIIAACVILIYIVSMFLYRRKQDGQRFTEVSDCFVQGTQAQVFSASLTGFLFGASMVLQAIAFVNPGDRFAELKNLPLAERAVTYMTAYPFDFMIFFASALCAVYFFKTAAMNFDIGENIEQMTDRPAYKFSSAHIIFSFMPVIWTFLNVFKRFFDMSQKVNSPVVIYELVSFLVLAAYFVSESRMLVERRETSKFFTFAYIAVILAAVSALPNLIWSSFWLFQIPPNSDQIIYGVEISIVIYILSRIYSQIRYSRFLFQRNLLCKTVESENAEDIKNTKNTEE